LIRLLIFLDEIKTPLVVTVKKIMMTISAINIK